MGAIFFIIAILLVAGVPAAAEERLALLVGNSRYEEIVPLRNPENDIEVISQSLQAVGFKTKLVKNATKLQLESALKDFVTSIKNADEKPIVLFYFAGHGLQVDGRNYLLPVEFSGDDFSKIFDTATSMEYVAELLRDTPAKIELLIFDACRNDPFERSKRAVVPIKRGLASILEPKGQLFAFSTSPGRTASDGATGTSPYASALAEAILMPALTIRQMFDRVRVKVSERTNGEQVPWESAALYSDFYFIAPTQAVQVSEIEALLWDNVALLDSAEAYQRYIDRFPNGVFARIAMQKIENINRDFVFRKQAEMFDVLSANDSKLDFCYERSIQRKLPTIYSQFMPIDRFSGEIMYVDIYISLSALMCDDESDTIPDITIYSADRECRELLDISTGIYEGKFATLNCAGKYEDDEYAIVKSTENVKNNGGIIISSGGVYLIFTTLNDNYFRYSFVSVEGIFENTGILVQGLARVHSTIEEEDQILELEPVDPASLGLSWKFFNTLEAYRKADAGSGIRIVSLSEEGAKWEAGTDESPLTDETPLAETVLQSSQLVNHSVLEDGDITSEWRHNGSTMGLMRKGDLRAIVYLEPRKGLAELDIGPGTWLFVGRTHDGKRYEGESITFSAQCDGHTYRVSGIVDDFDRRIVLTGHAPTIDRNCNVTGTKKVEMVFEYIRRAAPN